jgi:hypothetical protein
MRLFILFFFYIYEILQLNLTFNRLQKRRKYRSHFGVQLPDVASPDDVRQPDQYDQKRRWNVIRSHLKTSEMR